MKRVAIKVEDNIKEILTFLEKEGYKWFSGNKPTEGLSWGSRFIVIEDKIITHRTAGNEPKAITFEQFKKNLIMKTNNILPGYKLVLENGNVFVVKEYKDTKIVFSEDSSRSVTSLDYLCEADLTPKPGIVRIMKVLNSLNIPIWERKFTRDEIKSGFTMTNENGVDYLVVNSNCSLRIMNTEHFVVGSQLCDIMNEDLTPTDSSYATIVEIKDREGKIVYKKG